MNKKGFTLVELLAVIAILAILVIIALPNVMGMFNQAKKNSFITETKNIYKVAQQQWINDSMFSTSNQEYGRCDGCSYKELSLSGRQEIKYYIKLDKSGKVITYRVDDGTYSFNYNGPGLEITAITEDLVTTSSGTAVATSNYVYTMVSNNLHVGNSIPSGVQTYNDYNSALSGSDFNVFNRLKVENNVITEISVGFMYNGNVYYLPANNTYSNNKSLLYSIYGNSICQEDSDEQSAYIYCSDFPAQIYILVRENGYIDITESGHEYGWRCKVEQGAAYCSTYFYQ